MTTEINYDPLCRYGWGLSTHTPGTAERTVARTITAANWPTRATKCALLSWFEPDQESTHEALIMLNEKRSL